MYLAISWVKKLVTPAVEGQPARYDTENDVTHAAVPASPAVYEDEIQKLFVQHNEPEMVQNIRNPNVNIDYYCVRASVPGETPTLEKIELVEGPAVTKPTFALKAGSQVLTEVTE